MLVYGNILYICPLYFLYRFGGESLCWGLFGGGVGFLLVFVPHVAVHVLYMFADYNNVVIFHGNRWDYVSESNLGRDLECIFSSDEVDMVIANIPYS